jgi:hypothetical protein
MNQTLKNITDETSAANEIERVKLDLLSLVSHELRTPLTSVLGSLRMLKEGGLDPQEQEQFLDLALRNAEKLHLTLSQLLDLSKLVSGRLVCRFQEVSLKGVVLKELERMTHEAKEAGFELKAPGVRETAVDLPVILGDPPRIEQVFRSLFNNALKFSPPGSALEFRAQLTPKAIKFYFTNLVKEGVKPQKTKLDELFKIFAQQENVLNRSHEGVGGSLAISVEVIKQHSGKMKVTLDESSSKFTVEVELPVLESEEALVKVLEARMFALRTEVGAISLMLLDVGEKALRQVSDALRSALFRASDTVYCLTEAGQVAVVMDDCKAEDAPKIVGRLLSNMGAEASRFLKDAGAKVGIASSPEDTTDPEALLREARSRFKPIF